MSRTIKTIVPFLACLLASTSLARPTAPRIPCLPGVDGCPLADDRLDPAVLRQWGSLRAERAPHVSAPVEASCRVQAVGRAMESYVLPTVPTLTPPADTDAIAGLSLEQVRERNAITERILAEWMAFATTHGSHVGRLDSMICGVDGLSRKLPVVLADLEAGVEWPHDRPRLIGEPHSLPTDESWRWMPEYYKLAYGVQFQRQAPTGFDWTPFPSHTVCDVSDAQRRWILAAGRQRNECDLARSRGQDDARACLGPLARYLDPRPPGRLHDRVPAGPDPGPMVCLDDYGQGSGCQDDPQVAHWPYYSRVAAQPNAGRFGGTSDADKTRALISEVQHAGEVLRALRSRLAPIVAPVDAAIPPGLAVFGRTLALETERFGAEQAKVLAEQAELVQLEARLKAARSRLEQRTATAASLSAQQSGHSTQLARDEAALAEGEASLRNAAARADAALAASQAATGLDRNGYARHSESDAAYAEFRAALKAQMAASARRLQTRRLLSQVRRQLSGERAAMAVLRLEINLRQPEYDRRLTAMKARQSQLEVLRAARQAAEIRHADMGRVFAALVEEKEHACEAHLGPGASP